MANVSAGGKYVMMHDGKQHPLIGFGTYKVCWLFTRPFPAGLWIRVLQ